VPKEPSPLQDLIDSKMSARRSVVEPPDANDDEFNDEPPKFQQASQENRDQMRQQQMLLSADEQARKDPFYMHALGLQREYIRIAKKSVDEKSSLDSISALDRATGEKKVVEAGTTAAHRRRIEKYPLIDPLLLLIGESASERPEDTFIISKEWIEKGIQYGRRVDQQRRVYQAGLLAATTPDRELVSQMNAITGIHFARDNPLAVESGEVAFLRAVHDQRVTFHDYLLFVKEKDAQLGVAKGLFRNHFQ